MKRLIVLSVIGTRPEAIKMAPVAIAAAARPGISHRLVATGQHDTMLMSALAAFGLAVDHTLSLGAHDGSVEAMVAAIQAAVAALLSMERPDLLLVQGDTSSAYAAALAACDAAIPIGHVEAGLRSHDPDLPWPEERNRVAIDRRAALLFAPTERSRANLLAEGIADSAITVTGNTGIDALLLTRVDPGSPLPAGRRMILVTCHRRENIGAHIAGIGAALRMLAARGDVRILLPVHPNPEVAAGVRRELSGIENIDLVPPLGYVEMVRAMRAADFILTDSGGLQEEAPVLGVPVLVLRDVTERPEALATGNIALVGTDPGAIFAAATRLLDDRDAHAAMARPASPYGDGAAAARILDAIESWAAG